MDGSLGLGQGGHDRWAGESDRWRWPVVLLVVVLHLGLYLLLRSAVGAVEPVRTAETQRIRLVWSERERPAPATPQDPSSARQAARPLPQRRVERGAATTPGAAAVAIPYTDEDDAWSVIPGSGPASGTDFARDPLKRPDGPDPFAPVDHLPGLRMRDSSLGGWLQEQARLRACGELKAALSSRAESTHAILASMRRWNCTI